MVVEILVAFFCRAAVHRPSVGSAESPCRAKPGPAGASSLLGAALCAGERGVLLSGGGRSTGREDLLFTTGKDMLFIIWIVGMGHPVQSEPDHSR